MIGAKYRFFLGHQIVVPALFLLCALGASKIVASLAWSWWLDFLLSGALYSLLVAAICWVFPVVLGLHRSDLTNVRDRLRGLRH